MKICLDAGHYKNTPGKRTPDGVHEWELNDKVCKYIKEKLLEYKNVEVIRIDDESGNTDVNLAERVRRINAHNPSAMVSIHHNACSGTWGNYTGTEVYYHTLGSTQDNRLANIIAPKLAKKTGLPNRGAKKMSLAVLTCKAHIPAVLCEGGFMDGTKDSYYIRTETGQRAYAKAVVDSLVEFLNLDKVKPPVPLKKSNTEVAREVLAGKWGNGQDRKNRLARAGYNYAEVQAEVNRLYK